MWISPDDTTVNQIDHTLVDKRATSTYIGCEGTDAIVGTDHFLQ